MNRKTMPAEYRKDLGIFYRSVSKAIRELKDFAPRVIEVMYNLEMLIRAENEITIKDWCVRAGEVFVTLELPESKIDLSKEQGWIKETFPGCTIFGNKVEIQFGSL